MFQFLITEIWRRIDASERRPVFNDANKIIIKPGNLEDLHERLQLVSLNVTQNNDSAYIAERSENDIFIQLPKFQWVLQSTLAISKFLGLFFTSSNWPKCKLICTSGNLDLQKSLRRQVMVEESNQNVYLIQIDVSNFAEFEISEFEISRVDCIMTGKGHLGDQGLLLIQARYKHDKYYTFTK